MCACNVKRVPFSGDLAVVSVFEVTPWGKFTPALNALLGFAARDGAAVAMFQVGPARGVFASSAAQVVFAEGWTCFFPFFFAHV